jgi:hypothetical protein
MSSKRVIALLSADDNQIKTFGEGEYIGDKVPNVPPFNEIKLKNPCIKLDTGKYVWGFQTWWGNVDKVKERVYDKAGDRKIVTVDAEEALGPQILPIEEHEDAGN